MPRGLVTNLCLQSESLTTSPWTTTNVTTSAASSPWPTDGSGIAAGTVLTGNNVVNQHYGIQLHTNVTNWIVASCYVKKISGNGWCNLTTEVSSTSYAYFDLNTGVVGSTGAGTTSGIVAAGNSWYRIWLASKTGSFNTSRYFAVKLAQSGSVISYDATGDAIAFTGAMLEIALPGQTTPSPYIVTAAATATKPRDYRNNALLAYSESITTSTWARTNASVTMTANSVANPLDGATNASLVDFTNASGAGIYPTQNFGVQLPANPRNNLSQYTVSCWVRTPSSSGTFAFSNSMTGTTFGGTQTATTSWQRFTVTINTGVAELNSSGYHPMITHIAGGSAQFYIWGMQFTKGNTVADYAKVVTSPYNPSGSPRRATT